MPGRRKIAPDVEDLVRRRADGVCEYCHAVERWQYVRFTVDHVSPLSMGGDDESDNLALACVHCNRRKSDRSTGADPGTGEEADLFHPRRHVWAKHFAWSSDRLRILGVTSIGRVTIVALQMNRPRVLQIREADLAIGRHPPGGDPVTQD